MVVWWRMIIIWNDYLYSYSTMLLLLLFRACVFMNHLADSKNYKCSTHDGFENIFEQIDAQFIQMAITFTRSSKQPQCASTDPAQAVSLSPPTKWSVPRPFPTFHATSSGKKRSHHKLLPHHFLNKLLQCGENFSSLFFIQKQARNLKRLVYLPTRESLSAHVGIFLV